MPKPFNIADLIPVILSHRRGPKKPAPLVDADLALQRLAGDKPLFAKIARQFVRDSAGVPDQLANALARQTPAEGAALLHRLKSQAGTMGAQRLAGMAAGLEAELKLGSLAVDVAGLRQLLAATNSELSFIADAMTPPPSPGTLSDAVLADRLAELDKLLEAGNMRALEICAAIEENRRSIADDPFAAISLAVDKLDFPAARKALKAMAGTLAAR